MNKYKKGRYLGLTDLLEELGKRRWVYLRDIPKHPTVIENMTLLTICGFIHRKMFYRAIETNNNKKGEK